MPRPAPPGLLGLILLLSGCSGAGQFLSDTFTWWGVNPNMPIGNSETMRRVKGLAVEAPPLTPEPGNIWPGPVQQGPTLEDLERESRNAPAGTPPTPALPPLPGLQGTQPGTQQPSPQPPSPPRTGRRQPRGSSTPPANTQPGLPPELSTPPLPAPQTPAPAPAPPSTILTPRGPATVGPPVNSGGARSVTIPGAGQGLLVPNGNGTSTLIGPDGSVTTVPTPR